MFSEKAAEVGDASGCNGNARDKEGDRGGIAELRQNHGRYSQTATEDIEPPDVKDMASNSDG